MRSLNISTKNKITREKIFTICKENHDIFFLSDIKLNSPSQRYAVHDIEKYFLLNGYKFYHNSTKSIRGVGILIRSKLAHTIISRKHDNDCNMLLLHVNFEGKEIILGSLYGPNTNEERFFYNLSNHLQNLPCKIKILGGDMNLTLDPSNVNVNLDVLNMANIPSIFRSEKMIEIKNRFNLVDPYRSLHPNRREYTFLPSAHNLQNRSRIDFFLVNVESIPFVRNCTIPHNLLSTHFDHKMISLSFKKVKNPKNYPIKNNILLEVEVNWQIKASVIETYIQHAEITENFMTSNIVY